MKKYKVLIVTANYYPEISEKLRKGAKKVKKAHTDHEEIIVPGIFEIPVTISKNIDSYDGFIALGCVIKGKTPHFKLISKAVTNAIMNLSITYKKPIGNGILTCLNKKQALKRLEKGAEASKAIEQIFINESKLKSNKS
ncbi:MAG TPA: 6,7-dimethyl-8-ribityllumazine synthase [Pelagibacteraceae bacterium]|jgi:6,7-dimethyl-8-ribityllumazine synthase|nr:6,7-dimethyl-8-ribityllumazine synthase [Pelagibacteraceae bacterium]|tara:strand:+ start:342 stop:758 length:417 start_codon:yes stop_codon:yes gene_type:complete